jgi:hypothetical protein
MNVETTPHRLYNNARSNSENLAAPRESDRAAFSRICAELSRELEADPVTREALTRVFDRL